MARILVAASPEPSAVVGRVLAGHELSVARDIAEARALLEAREFDLILCTILFDDSRMFDLLRMVKASPRWEAIPFVCAKVRQQVLSWAPHATEAVAFTCRLLGARAFLDVSNYDSDPERKLREDIERLLPASA